MAAAVSLGELAVRQAKQVPRRPLAEVGGALQAQHRLCRAGVTACRERRGNTSACGTIGCRCATQANRRPCRLELGTHALEHGHGAGGTRHAAHTRVAREGTQRRTRLAAAAPPPATTICDPGTTAASPYRASRRLMNTLPPSAVALSHSTAYWLHKLMAGAPTRRRLFADDAAPLGAAASRACRCLHSVVSCSKPLRLPHRPRPCAHVYRCTCIRCNCETCVYIRTRRRELAGCRPHPDSCADDVHCARGHGTASMRRQQRAVQCPYCTVSYNMIPRCMS